jgi:hypothetical protein
MMSSSDPARLPAQLAGRWGPEQRHTLRDMDPARLPARLLGDGDKGIEKVYGAENNILY